MTIYTVTAERSGDWWVLQCVGVPGAVCQVAGLDQAEEAIRSAILWVADVPEADVEVELHVVLPAVVRESIDAAKRFRRESTKAETSAALAISAAARELQCIGLTVSDIGTVLGVSHRDAGQLILSPAMETEDEHRVVGTDASVLTGPSL